jgi:hypothetical protein
LEAAVGRTAAIFGRAAAFGFAVATARGFATAGFALACAFAAARGFALAFGPRRPMGSCLVAGRLPSTLGLARDCFFAFLGLEDLSLIAGAVGGCSEHLPEILQTVRRWRSTVIGPARRAGR